MKLIMDPLYTHFTLLINVNMYHFYFDIKMFNYLLYLKNKGSHFEWPRDKLCWRSSESSILHLIIVYFVLKSRSWLLLKSIKLGATANCWRKQVSIKGPRRRSRRGQTMFVVYSGEIENQVHVLFTVLSMMM